MTTSTVKRIKKTTSYNTEKWRAVRAAAVRPRYAFAAESLDEAKQWQRALRRSFVRRLGGFPPENAPLQPQVLARADCGDYVRETIEFQGLPGMTVFGYMLVPKNATGPLPALLCLNGHGYGVDPIVGLHGGDQVQNDEYQREFAVQAVRQGYAALAIEILGFGRRTTEVLEDGGRSTCQVLSGTALMMGETVAGWRAYESMRAIDYLGMRPEVDARRIGVMGISGGGLNALYLAAIDTRVRAAVVSGFYNTFRDSIMAIEHCIDNFVPGLLQDAEMSDIAGLVVPRALWCESGSEDTIFPVKPFRRALRDVKKIYEVFGVPGSCGGEVFSGGHQIHGKGAWPFLAKHLKQ